MKAIGYCRVSTPGQVEEGVSLDAQRAKIEAWCVANDAELGTVHVDAGLSGKRADSNPDHIVSLPMSAHAENESRCPQNDHGTNTEDATA